MSAKPLKISSVPRLESESLDDSAARLVLDMAGVVLYANNACEELAGPSKGRNFLDIAQFDEPDDVFRHSPLLFAGENDVFTALRSGLHVVRFAGSAQAVQLQFDIVRAQDGARYVIASALQDDRDFSASVESLINSAPPEQETALNHFLDLSNDLLTIARSDGSFENVNENFTTILGYTVMDLKGRNFLDLVHPDDRAAIRTSMQTILRDDDHTVIDFECRLISNEARVLWTDWKHKKIDGKLFSVGRDITGLKKQEQALLHRERQLSEAEAIGHMGHWHWAIGQQEIRFSDEIFRIFGVTREQFKPTLDSVNAMLHRRDVGRMIQAFQRAIIEQNDHEIDFRVIGPNGDVRHVRCQGRCEFDSTGDVTGLYGIMQDVTQAQLHERALMESKESAERAYAAKSQFLANMSHELRTPLNAIIGFSEMMQQQLLGPIGNERYVDYIKGIRESGEHLLELITDILDMSKIEAGKYELDLEDLNLTKIINLAVHMMEGRAVEAGIKMQVKMSDQLRIFGDRRAITQIMLNLLSNAVKFSHENGRIEIECIERDEGVSIRVRDYGIGIPANKIKTITNPFEQAANQYTRGHEGSGLGLSITKELAELHGGGIHIESTVGVGTTVTIRLPYKAKQNQIN